MSEYQKINSIYKRDLETKRFIDGEWSTPEIAYLHNKPWTWDEKIDGMNIRIGWNGMRAIWGRTDNASIPAHLFARLDSMFQPELLAKVFPKASPEERVILYGEGYGLKIQKGGSYLPDRCDFILFDVRIGRWWLERPSVEEIAKALNCETTPIVGEGTIREAIEYVKRGFKSRIGTADAEGLVLRPKVTLLARSGERIITKLKTKDFA